MTDKTEAQREREAVVAWLRLPRKATYATFRIRMRLAFLGLFHPNILVSMTASALGDCIEDRDHIKGDGE